jgi:hypothetical protein
MKTEWNSQLGNGRDVHYSIEPSEPLWGITAQVRGSVVLHQTLVEGPITRQKVEEHFRDDLMKEPPPLVNLARPGGACVEP